LKGSNSEEYKTSAWSGDIFCASFFLRHFAHHSHNFYMGQKFEIWPNLDFKLEASYLKSKTKPGNADNGSVFSQNLV